MEPYLKIVSTGISVPDKVLTNQDLEKMVETSDEWIITRTGIRERRVSAPGVASSDLGTQAAQMALDAAGISAAEVELLLVATASGDYLFPSTACVVQKNLGADQATAFDISAACSGFLYGLTVAYSLMKSGSYRNALVIGAETLTKITDYQDRSTCVIFGDGAGAMLVTLGNDNNNGIFASHLGSDGKFTTLSNLPAGGTRLPATADTVRQHRHFIKMEGNELFKVAVRSMEEAARLTLKKAGLTTADVDILIPHQANLRIINALIKRLGIPDERVYINIERYGNTSAASIPIAYHEARSKGLLSEDSVVLLVAFGGGITWAGVLLRG
ncbi:MAG: ketoacyl-ACP synthase III [Candidatus Glassbacteria bacterium]|nr:ketoacyl-ACP synthase III [Candidatus Glassbacteria bacterium]